MISIHQIVNSYRHSCTYILSEENCEYVWLIDCGDYEAIKQWLFNNEKNVIGVFLTHGHIDHVYGLKELLEYSPETTIYLSANGGLECLHNTRLNISRFTARPLSIDVMNYVELKDGDMVKLFNDSILRAYQTEGHSPDSIILNVDKYLFTGDAFIPPLEVVTKLPGGNNIKAQLSRERIDRIIKKGSLIVLPGHSIENNEY